MTDAPLSTSEILHLLSSYPLKVQTVDGDEFLCIADTSSAEWNMEDSVLLRGLRKDGHKIEVTLSMYELDSGGHRASSSMLRLNDKYGVPLQIELLAPLSIPYGNDYY